MGSSFQSKSEKLIVHDEKLLFTLTSYAAVLAIFVNLNGLQSPLIGLMASFIYFLINGVFLGNAFFGKEEIVLKILLGILLLAVLLGVVGWLIMILYNLDAARSTLVLLIVTTLSSLLNREMRHKNVS